MGIELFEDYHNDPVAEFHDANARISPGIEMQLAEIEEAKSCEDILNEYDGEACEYFLYGVVDALYEYNDKYPLKVIKLLDEFEPTRTVATEYGEKEVGNRPPRMSEILKKIGIPRSCWERWRKKKNKDGSPAYPLVARACVEYKALRAEVIEDNSLMGLYNTMMAKHILDTKFRKEDRMLKRQQVMGDRLLNNGRQNLIIEYVRVEQEPKLKEIAIEAGGENK